MKTMTRYSKACRNLAIVSILFVAFAASANTTNIVPTSDSFEGYGAGDFIAGTNGWYGDPGTYAIVTNGTGVGNAYGGSKPLAGATHNNVIMLDDTGGSITNFLNTTETNVWIDSMVQFTHWTDEEPPPTGAAAYLDSVLIGATTYDNADADDCYEDNAG